MGGWPCDESSDEHHKRLNEGRDPRKKWIPTERARGPDLVQEFVTGSVDRVGHSVDPVLSERPVSGVDSVADRWENGGVVT